MIPIKKINLSAMAKKNKIDKAPETETKEEIVSVPVVEIKQEIATVPVLEIKEEEKVSLIPKISLMKIKTNKSPNEIKEEKELEEENEHAEKKEELLETLTGVQESDKTLIEDIKTDLHKTLDNNLVEKLDEEKVENKNEVEITNDHKKEHEVDDEDEDSESEVNKEKINLEEIEKKINENVEAEVKEKIKKLKIVTTDEIEDEKKEMFGNYKSEFTEKEDIIIEKVEKDKKKLKERLREPKTRIALVLGLIILTLAVIAGLFILDPKNHSFAIYKTDIENNINKIKNSYINKPWELNVTTVEKYNFDTYTQNKLFGGKNYKYKEIIYTDKTALDNVINAEVSLFKQEADIKQEKIRIEQEKIEADKIRIEQEKIRIDQEKIDQENKRKEEFNKIKDILHEKLNDLFQKR